MAGRESVRLPKRTARKAAITKPFQCTKQQHGSGQLATGHQSRGEIVLQQRSLLPTNVTRSRAYRAGHSRSIGAIADDSLLIQCVSGRERERDTVHELHRQQREREERDNITDDLTSPERPWQSSCEWRREQPPLMIRGRADETDCENDNE